MAATRPSESEQIGLFITARSGSTRLPRKTLLPLHGRPAIAHLFDRVRQSQAGHNGVLCTTTLAEDGELADLARECGLGCFRGAVEDVLERYRAAFDHYGWPFAVVVDGDDLFCPPEAMDLVVGRYLETGADFITTDGLPFGANAHGLRAKAVRRVCELKADDAPAVWGRYFTETGQFNVEKIPVTDPALTQPPARMSLDYPEDLMFFEAVLDELYRPGAVCSLREIMALLRRRPDIVAINAGAQEAWDRRSAALYSAVRLRR